MSKKKTKRKKKPKEYKLKIVESTCYRVVLDTPDGRTVQCSNWNQDREEVEAYLERTYARYGDDAGAGLVFDLRHPTKSPKRKGWVVITPKGKRHEYEDTTKKDTKYQYLKKINKTRLPRGTKIEKLV